MSLQTWSSNCRRKDCASRLPLSALQTFCGAQIVLIVADLCRNEGDQASCSCLVVPFGICRFCRGYLSVCARFVHKILQQINDSPIAVFQVVFTQFLSILVVPSPAILSQSPGSDKLVKDIRTSNALARIDRIER
jgi:hypothetical protein